MPITLPSIKPLLQSADTHPCNADYPAFPRIFISGASCLGKRALDVDPFLETFSPRKRPFRVANGEIERQLRKSLPLPIEIQNEILETFWDHKDIECFSPETIRACALTCKAWNKVARRHIFRVIILRSWEQLDRLKTQMLSDEKVIGWVQRVRLCGSLPPFDKASAGKELPTDWALQDRWLYLFPHHLSERIRDRTSRSYQSFNVRIFELFDFAHLSGAVEDCKWFAFWIHHLPWLQSVETLYLRSCEMSSNAMTALAHCFPRLRRVGLTNVDVTAKNYAIFRHAQASLMTEEKILEQLAEKCALSGLDFSEALRQRTPWNGVEYRTMNPTPCIESLYVNNQFSQYRYLDLNRLYGWFFPCQAKESLRSLELSGRLELCSVAELFDDIGPSPVLEHLRLWAGCTVELLESYNFNISKLTNLKSLALHGGFLDSLLCEVFLHVLSTLNAPALRRVTLTFQLDDDFKDVKEIDQCLNERFKNLEVLIVECIGLEEGVMEEARREIQDMFLQMERRGMLRVQSYMRPFRY